MNAQDKDSYTALHLATFHQHYSCVQLLLQLGAHVNSSSRYVLMDDETLPCVASSKHFSHTSQCSAH